MKGIKGFDKDLKCKDFQYEIGKTYECEEKIKACANGFHSIPEDESPLNVFEYYPPAGLSGAPNRYCVVESDGDIDKDEYKIASSKITIGKEIDILGIIDRHIEWAGKNRDNVDISEKIGYASAATNTGNRSVASNTGHHSAATNTGYRSVASNKGDRSAATETGNYSAAVNTGEHSAATSTGSWSAAANTGDHSAATNTGYRSFARNIGEHSAAINTGDHSAASNAGDCSAALSIGYDSAAEVKGKDSIAIAWGEDSKARASLGSAIVIAEYGEWNGETYPLVGIKSAIIDGVQLKPDTWYKLKGGEFIECE